MTDFEAGPWPGPRNEPAGSGAEGEQWPGPDFHKSDPSQPTRRSFFRRGGVIFALGTVTGASVMGAATYVGRGPLVRWALEGDSQYTQLDWDRLQVPDSRQPEWQRFARDPEVTSSNPADFTKVGLVAVDAEAFDKHRRDNNAQQATAWRVNGSTIDVGTMPTGQSFYSSVLDDGGRYVFGQRIGGSDLAWTPGLRIPETGQFEVPPDADVQSLGTVAIADLQDKFPGAIYV